MHHRAVEPHLRRASPGKSGPADVINRAKGAQINPVLAVLEPLDHIHIARDNATVARGKYECVARALILPAVNQIRTRAAVQHIAPVAAA